MDFNIFNKKSNLKAFTLIEIMIVLSILAILGGITISSDYKTTKIRNSILIDTESVAVDIRDMQNRTINFIYNDSVNNVGYGVFFDMKNPLKVESFYKTDGDFDPSELLISNSFKPSDDFIFNIGNYIKRICLNGCAIKELNSSEKLAIYFKKPKLYSNFSYSDNGLIYYTNLYPSGNAINHVCIEIGAYNSSETRKVDIYYIGQISFGYGNCEN